MGKGRSNNGGQKQPNYDDSSNFSGGKQQQSQKQGKEK
jgi:hypothetical protein